MASPHFHRLPERVRNLVTGGLDDEIRTGFEKIEQAQKAGSVDETGIRAVEGDIVRASELRKRFTGEEAR